MALPPLIRPKVVAQPTLDTAIWLLQLRWLAAAGQLLTMAVVVWAFQIALPVNELFGLIGITAITNGLYWFWLNRLHRRGLQLTEQLPQQIVIPVLMLADILVLTGMLYISAGMANPFGLFYFVNIAVAGAILAPAWAWAIWLATVAGVTTLLTQSQPIEILSTASLLSSSDDDVRVWSIPKFGFWVAFATCSGVITYFITVLTGELRRREQAMQEAEDARVRNRQLEGLATLATGAAHELATPMTTIAVVAKELSRALEKADAPDSVREDAKLIRSELDQCREILDRMTSAAGDAAGERLERINVGRLAEECVLGLRGKERVQIFFGDVTSKSQPTNLLPLQATAQAIRNLIQNALDASEQEASVTASFNALPEEWQIEIADRGPGMSTEVIERIGEPFFTTKEPGRGMGLGLYLTQNVVRRLDGELRFESEVGKGTTAILRIPTSRS
ncbi:MAG: ATP-binding protein [Aureliella sp.]